MIFNNLLLLLGLFGIYHTSRFHNTHITNMYILFLTITLTIFFQVLFVDQFFPYHTHFSTEYTIAYILQKYLTTKIHDFIELSI